MSLADLSDTPLPPPTPTGDADFYLTWLATLLEDEQYAFAHPTLAGIRETIVATGAVTVGQRRAVSNIVRGAEEGQRQYEDARIHHRPRRRYEGWTRQG